MPASTRTVRALCASAAFSMCCVQFAHAQFADRPPIARGADPNDWEAYYNAAVEILPRDSRAAEAEFAWASRLRPDRAEPLYGQWIAYWARDAGRFADYLNDDAKVLADPKVIRADSLRASALRRSPFVHQGLVMFLFDRMPGKFRDDDVTRAWISLGQAELPVALERFGRIVQREPRKYGYLRFIRASAFVNTARYDSAAAELNTLLAQLRADDAKTLGNGYQSKEMLEYAIGLLHLRAGRATAARDAFGRAVAENAAFAPAHASLGRLATSSRDTLTALAEFALAVETDPGDVDIRIGYGQALTAARRPADAAIQFQKAIALEPLYADPYYFMGAALDAVGDKSASMLAFSRFLERATKTDPRRGEAQRRSSPGER